MLLGAGKSLAPEEGPLNGLLTWAETTTSFLTGLLRFARCGGDSWRGSPWPPAPSGHGGPPLRLCGWSGLPQDTVTVAVSGVPRNSGLRGAHMSPTRRVPAQTPSRAPQMQPVHFEDQPDTGDLGPPSAAIIAWGSPICWPQSWAAPPSGEDSVRGRASPNQQARCMSRWPRLQASAPSCCPPFSPHLGLRRTHLPPDKGMGGL